MGEVTGTESSLKFYLWRPFPEIEGAFIAEQVRSRGDTMWDSQHQADVIFAFVRVVRGSVVIQEVRQNNGRAVLVALIKQGTNGELKQRCLAAGANMAFYMPVKEQGFKAMFRRIYAQL